MGRPSFPLLLSGLQLWMDLGTKKEENKVHQQRARSNIREGSPNTPDGSAVLLSTNNFLYSFVRRIQNFDLLAAVDPFAVVKLNRFLLVLLCKT